MPASLPTASTSSGQYLALLLSAHGADLNLAVRLGAVPYNVQRHDCRGIIAATVAPRHRASYDQTSGRRHDDVPQARLFLCAVLACRAQVLICRDCDRGHINCGECTPTARQRSLRRAGRRYQASAIRPGSECRS